MPASPSDVHLRRAGKRMTSDEEVGVEERWRKKREWTNGLPGKNF